MPTFVQRTPLPLPAAELYAWHLRPGAFERLTPPWERVQVLERSGPIGEGARVLLRMRKGLLSFRWEALHSDFVPDRQFRDVQVRGPFSRWSHTHRFVPEGATACVLEDEIEYALPLGAVGQILAGRGIARDLRAAFTYRHQRTRADLLRHAAYPGQRLRVLIGGATGLVGANLAAFLSAGGHRVDRLVRRTPAGGGSNEYGGLDLAWDPAAGKIDAAALEGIDAVVHLSGASIAGGRWTPAFKAEIRRSRVGSTRLLCETLGKLHRPPRTLICASAVGFYGNRGDDVVDERAAAGVGFLPEVCQEWEAAADPARAAGIRVVHLRFGVIIAASGGALAKMRTPFGWGVGGVVGSGRQWMSWIALDDAVYGIHHLLFTPDLAGAVNATAPRPVTNREFTGTLGGVLRRPTILPLPAFAVRLLFGEMGQACLLEGVRALPTRLSGSGFQFAYPDLEAALRTELGRSPT